MRRPREVDKDTNRLSKNEKKIYAGVAQLVEQRIRKRKVIAAKTRKFNNMLLWLSW